MALGLIGLSSVSVHDPGCVFTRSGDGAACANTGPHPVSACCPAEHPEVIRIGLASMASVATNDANFIIDFLFFSIH